MAGTKRSVRPRTYKPAASHRSSENVPSAGNDDSESLQKNKRARVAKGFHVPKRVLKAEPSKNSEDHVGISMPEFHRNTTLKAIEKNTAVPSSHGGSSLHNVASLEAKFNHLQKKYRELKAIRYTEPERLLNNLQEKFQYLVFLSLFSLVLNTNFTLKQVLTMEPTKNEMVSLKGLAKIVLPEQKHRYPIRLNLQSCMVRALTLRFAVSILLLHSIQPVL